MDDILAVELLEAEKDVSDDLAQILFWDMAKVFVCRLVTQLQLSLLLILRLLLHLPKRLFAELHDNMDAVVLDPAVEVSHNVRALRFNAQGGQCLHLG